MFAVWALPETKDFDYLSNIINELSKKYEFHTFFPHITLYGLVDVDSLYLENVIADSIINIKPFHVEKEKIDYSDDFWKSIFILIKKNQELEKIHSTLAKNLKKFAIYDLIPHLSFAYKNLEKDEKIKIIESLEIKNDFTIDKIGILEFSQNIKKWKIIKKFYLN